MRLADLYWQEDRGANETLWRATEPGRRLGVTRYPEGTYSIYSFADGRMFARHGLCPIEAQCLLMELTREVSDEAR